MKKLLLVGMVAIGFAHQADAMVFKRNEKKQFVPVIHAAEFRYREEKKENIVSEPVIPLIIVVKDANDKPIMVSAKEYITEKSTIKIKKNKQDDMPEERDIETAVNMLDATDKGNHLYMQKTVLNKDAMNQWCDNFKKNSKKPGLWNKDYKEEKELNLKGYSYYWLNGKLVKESFKYIANEAGLDDRPNGIQVTYVDKRERKEDPRYAGLKLGSDQDISLKDAEYFPNFNKSPYYKELKQNKTSLPNELENYAYHNALESLEATKKEMQNDLSCWNWIFNNKKYNRTNGSLKGLNDEIAWFKQPKTRDLFAKSSMHPDLYGQLKTARE